MLLLSTPDERTKKDNKKIDESKDNILPVAKAASAIKKNMGSRIMLTNNEMKDIIKVIRSLENRRILLKGTTKKNISQEGRLLYFLNPLVRVGLPLMKNVITSLAKSI